MTHKIFECCFRSLTLTVVLLASLFLVSGEQVAQAASPTVELKKMFRDVDRRICRSFAVGKCKRQAVVRKSRPKVAVAKPLKPKKVTTVAERDEPKTKAAPPTPVLKKSEVEKADVPTPVLKPARFTKSDTAPEVPTPISKKTPVEKLPEIKVVALPTPVLPRLKPPPSAAPEGAIKGETCFDRLGEMGVNFTRVPTTVGAGSCSVTNPVQIQSITAGGQTVKFYDSPTLNCNFALTFARWVGDEAAPILKTATGKGMASLGTGPGYQCRGRNGSASGKISEHGFGNAVDIERIKLAGGETIEIKDAITPSAKYQPALAALRAAGCRSFTTVLGPGANAAHASHFHFDLQRRGKKGNHKMCQ